MQVLEILQKIGYSSTKETQTHYAFRPLYRPSDNDWALAVNKKTGNWYDFVQKQGGSIYKLVAITKGFKTKKEVETFLECEVVLPDHDVYHGYELSEIKKFDKNLLVKLMKNHDYWVSRGISARTVSTFEGGVTFNGRMKNRYVFPIFDEHDELIGFSGRLLDINMNLPKWKHIGAKSNWCYPLKWNYNLLLKLKEVILIESIGDMLALWEAGVKNTIVTFGIGISHSIIEFLLRIDAQRILISFNNDEQNNLVGNDAADKERRHLMKYFDDSQIIIAIPDYKDFGEMDGEQINLWKSKFQIQNS